MQYDKGFDPDGAPVEVSVKLDLRSLVLTRFAAVLIPRSTGT